MTSLEYAWIGVGITILGTVSGQLTYKLFSLNKKKTFLLLAIGSFGIAQLTNYFALREIPIGIVYMMAASNYVIILFASKIILKENINRTQIYAVALIVCGILLYGVGYFT